MRLDATEAPGGFDAIRGAAVRAAARAAARAAIQKQRRAEGAAWKAARVARGLSTDAVAAAMGWHVSTQQAIERGTVGCPVARRAALAELLGIEPPAAPEVPAHDAPPEVAPAPPFLVEALQRVDGRRGASWNARMRVDGELRSVSVRAATQDEAEAKLVRLAALVAQGAAFDDAVLVVREGGEQACRSPLVVLRDADACPHTGCRYHLARDEHGHRCALMWAERGGMALEDIAELFGLTRERVRQIEAAVLQRPSIRATLRRLGIDPGFAHAEGLAEHLPQDDPADG